MSGFSECFSKFEAVCASSSCGIRPSVPAPKHSPANADEYKIEGAFGISPVTQKSNAHSKQKFHLLNIDTTTPIRLGSGSRSRVSDFAPSIRADILSMDSVNIFKAGADRLRCFPKEETHAALE